MKKHLKIIGCLTVTIVILSTIGCNKYEKKINEASHTFMKNQEKKIKNFKIADSLFAKSWKDLGFDEKALAKALTDPMKNEYLAKAYIAYFKNSAKPLSREIGGGQTEVVETTENVWIDKEAILSFAKEILDNPEIDGIRLYNARYLDFASSLDPQMNNRFNGRQTVVFVATKKMNNGKYDYHQDYYDMPSNPATALYIYDYNSLCPPADTCTGSKLGGY